MHKNKTTRRTPATPAPHVAPAAKQQRPNILVRHSRMTSFIGTFLLFFLFFALVYGDVLRRTAEANFITTSAEQMKFLTDKAGGYLYLACRWLLLIFTNVWMGAALLSLILTLTAMCINRLWENVLGRWGMGAIVPGLVAGWMLWRGVNLFYKGEPSLFLLIALITLTVAGLALTVKHFIKKGKPAKHGGGWHTLVTPAAVTIALTAIALTRCDNDIRTARMQMAVLESDWQTMIDTGAEAKHPTRAVAAYYAIGLLQTDQLLNRVFDIPYDFPDARLDAAGGIDEYGIFTADCNYYAGLINAGYRCAMDQVVMNGPNLYYLKRMAVCAIAKGEKNLALKYLRIIGSVPFERGFVDYYTPLAENFDRAAHNEEIARVHSLAPMESHFEQNYRTPAFLGYNTGLSAGSNATLVTSIAACLYSKELPQAMQRISIYTQKNGTQLPVALQQAICIASTKVNGVNELYGDIINANRTSLMNFVTAAKPILDERTAALEGKTEQEQVEIKNQYNARLRKELGPEWLGSYYYYYYCENNDPKQTQSTEDKHGVN